MIKYLEQTVLESNSVISKGSKKSKTAKSVKSKSSADSVLEGEGSLCETRKGHRNRKVKTEEKTGRIQT